MTFLIGLFGVVVNLLTIIVFFGKAATEKIGDSLRISMLWLAVCDFATLIFKVSRLKASTFDERDMPFIFLDVSECAKTGYEPRNS